ncbi:hypothetical protein EDD86DRAFT_215363 [Gorgonomyces haynaldii]|nr:hypothetical protein EDD86DRAFT_215363 [Gorgonomyces haynaldii]
MSFNGGKDCTVMLDLYKRLLEKIGYTKPIRCLYVCSGTPFPEVEQFVKACEKQYNLDIMKIQGPMKNALQVFLDSNRLTRAVLIGTRKGDPYSDKMTDFMPTDPSWPQTMRVHPILDWNYKQIWDYLKTQKVPYCVLYDQGYTSLGSIDNTHPNPLLKTETGYLPAHELQDHTTERHGRN